MNVPSNEPNLEQPTGDNVPEGQADNDGGSNSSPGHPAWQEILDVLPDSLHELVTPTLKKWDEGVNNKLTEVRSQYDPYKDLIENETDPVLIGQALGLVQQLNDNPAQVLEQVIEAFQLEDFIRKADLDALAGQGGNEPGGYDADNDEFFNDPRFKAMKDTLDQLQGQISGQQETAQQQKQAEEWENYLQKLETDHGNFDRDFVTALVANGMDGVAAVKRYHSTVSQAAAKLAEQNGINANGQQQTQVPVVMGSEGTAGAGVGTQPVKMGELSRSATNDLVSQILNAANAENT